MINIDDKTKCCGCTACASICPKQCIEMTADDEGFLYPVVDETLCVNCDLCVNTCPVINIPRSEQEPSAVVVRNKTKDILMDSTSGGAFSAIATALILKKRR